MIQYLETHGLEVAAIYFIFASIVSTMPPIGDNASYFARWMYGALHALAADWKQVMAMTKVQLPEAAPDSTVTKTEIKKTIVENKTEDKKET